MIMYTPMSLEHIFSGIENLSEHEWIEVNGLMMQVEPVNARQARIVRLISPNPQDYLNPHYAPGQLIHFNPFL